MYSLTYDIDPYPFCFIFKGRAFRATLQPNIDIWYYGGVIIWLGENLDWILQKPMSMCLNYAWVWRWVSIFTRLSQHTHTRYLSLVMTILTEELPIAFTFSQARVAHGTPITNDAPYVSCHEVKSTHLHGRTPRRGALPTDLRIQVWLDGGGTTNIAF